MTNETLETIKSRRSCRAYKPEQITDEELNAVLEAGTYAASAKRSWWCRTLPPAPSSPA